jgi:hypothetical protein
MAESLTAAGDPDGAILVAGASHVRNDYGIPVYLKANAREKTGDQPSLSLDKKPNRRVTRSLTPMADCRSITFGSRPASTTKTLVKSLSPSSIT